MFFEFILFRNSFIFIVITFIKKPNKKIIVNIIKNQLNLSIIKYYKYLKKLKKNEFILCKQINKNCFTNK